MNYDTEQTVAFGQPTLRIVDPHAELADSTAPTVVVGRIKTPVVPVSEQPGCKACPAGSPPAGVCMHLDIQEHDGGLSRPVAALVASTAIFAPALASMRYSPSRSLLTLVWYALLRKPRFNPPKIAFPIVWTGVDVSLASGAYRLARLPATAARNRALALFAANVALISGWSRLFFGQRDLGAAALGSVAIGATATAYVAAARRVDGTAAGTAVPLVAWVAFASVLSTVIWKMNRR